MLAPRLRQAVVPPGTERATGSRMVRANGTRVGMAKASGLTRMLSLVSACASIGRLLVL